MPPGCLLLEVVWAGPTIDGDCKVDPRLAGGIAYLICPEDNSGGAEGHLEDPA